jgi:hypothetical protein
MPCSVIEWYLCACQMAYNIDVVKTNVPEALEILVDSVVNPKFLSWEVNTAINKMREDIKTVKDNPQTVLLEVRATLNAMDCMHAACQISYQGNVASATVCSRHGLSRGLSAADSWHTSGCCTPLFCASL